MYFIYTVGPLDILVHVLYMNYIQGIQIQYKDVSFVNGGYNITYF